MAAYVAVAGLGLQAYSMISGANAEAEAAEQDAEIRRGQAKEVELAGLRSEQQTKEQALQIQGSQVAISGKNGQIGSGSALLALEDLHYRASREEIDIRHDWQYKQRMINTGAKFQEELASQRRTAGYIGAGGTVLTGAARAYSTYGDTNTKAPKGQV